MFVNGVPIDVVSGAYNIAANYLKRMGLIPHDVDFHQPLFDSIVEDFRDGNRNRLRLANRAIARFEIAREVLELIT
jgi:hypothetical protein